MSVVRARPLGALICGIAFGASARFSPTAPAAHRSTPILPVAREPIARALADAQARPQDASAAGRLGMLLHAWEQWEAAAAVYARARGLERRFDWFYLAGVVEARLAHHADAAALFKEAVAALANGPARDN